MKYRPFFLLSLMWICFLLSGLIQADQGLRRFGLGFTISESSSSIMSRIRLSKQVMLQPAFGFSWVDPNVQIPERGSITRLLPAMSLAVYLKPENELRFYCGIQGSVSVLLASGSTYSDLSFGQLFGCEYYLSSHFSVSGEVALTFTFTDDSFSVTQAEANATYIKTGQKLLAVYYF